MVHVIWPFLESPGALAFQTEEALCAAGLLGATILKRRPKFGEEVRDMLHVGSRLLGWTPS